MLLVKRQKILIVCGVILTSMEGMYTKFQKLLTNLVILNYINTQTWNLKIQETRKLRNKIMQELREN